MFQKQDNESSKLKIQMTLVYPYCNVDRIKYEKIVSHNDSSLNVLYTWFKMASASVAMALGDPWR